MKFVTRKTDQKKNTAIPCEEGGIFIEESINIRNRRPCLIETYHAESEECSERRQVEHCESSEYGTRVISLRLC